MCSCMEGKESIRQCGGGAGVEAEERELRTGCWEAEGETSFSNMVSTHQPVSLALLAFVLPTLVPTLT